MAAPCGIHGQVLEVTVVGCHQLKDTEWISRQDPYVCLEYATTKHRTRTCTDGGKNPSFNEKFSFSLIEGLREIVVHVWNSNTLSHDDYIGGGKILLQKVLSQGFDDTTWPLQTKDGRGAGEVKVIMHFSGVQKGEKPKAKIAPPSETSYAAGAYAPPPPSYPSAGHPTAGAYTNPPPYHSPSHPSAGGYAPPPSHPFAGGHAPPPSHPSAGAHAPPLSYPSAPTSHPYGQTSYTGYPPSTYSPVPFSQAPTYPATSGPSHPGVYPYQTYPPAPTYPPQQYPPAPWVYPPPPSY